MTRNLQLLTYGYFATHQAGGGWPVPGGELLTGGSPRYQTYTTSDGRHVAVAALEQKFWERLAQLLDLPDEFLDERGQESRVIEEIGKRIGAHTAEHWRALFDGEDVCTAVVATFDEAVSAGLVDIDASDRLVGDGFDVGALPSTVDPLLRRSPGRLSFPALGPLPDGPLWSPR
jgi:crotonobetainyl-CoA:carnitine CoA-transferase CaiB-like acyl-CoA transferase